MTCDQALEAISAALDGELSDAEREELEAHLASCPACRALYDDLCAIQADALDSALEVPEGFHDRVMAAVAEEPAVPPVQTRKKRSWKRWGGLVAVAAVAVLAVGPNLLSGLSGNGGSNTSAPAMASSLTSESAESAVDDVSIPAGQAELEDEADTAPASGEMSHVIATDRAAQKPSVFSTPSEPAEAPAAVQGEASKEFGGAASEGAARAYRAIVTVDGGLPEGYDWDEYGQLELAAEELEPLKAALDEAGISYTVQDSGDNIAADGSWVLVLPNG